MSALAEALGKAQGLGGVGAILAKAREVMVHYVRVGRIGRFLGVVPDDARLGMEDLLELEAVLEDGRDFLSRVYALGMAEFQRWAAEAGR